MTKNSHTDFIYSFQQINSLTYKFGLFLLSKAPKLLILQKHTYLVFLLISHKALPIDLCK